MPTGHFRHTAFILHLPPTAPHRIVLYRDAAKWGLHVGPAAGDAVVGSDTLRS
ncbi:hypothetical protein [Actinomyces qiguomingii]|uniref:hypothetical protein n=1 Tax=Actinomyces qiguomingii TaxID=2057800 RepID=UPI0013049202|nr:hypothetical protein [Actinomyces qiguomingii]